MAKYRIIKRERYYDSCWAEKGDPKKKLVTFQVQVRKWLRWSEFKKKNHPLWRSFETLEDAKEALSDFCKEEKSKKNQERNPTIVYHFRHHF